MAGLVAIAAVHKHDDSSQCMPPDSLGSAMGSVAAGVLDHGVGYFRWSLISTPCL